VRKIAASTADRRRGGFSLLEFVLAMAIFAIIVAIAAPRYGQAVARQRAEMAAKRIAADLSLARDRARIGGAQRTVTFTPATDQYQISDTQGLKNASADYIVDLAGTPYQLDLVSADFGGDTIVVFDGYGVPDSGGTVTVQIGAFLKTVVLDAQTGRATVQ